MEQIGNKPDNWQTKLNYNEHVKGLAAMAMFLPIAIAADFIEKGKAAKLLPKFLQGHMYDGFGGLVQAAFFKTITGNGTVTDMVGGFLACSSVEAAQGLGIIEGTFDWWDFPAYAVGALAFGAYDKSAKLLYDSGLTKPIYKALIIHDRRLNVYSNNQ